MPTPGFNISDTTYAGTVEAGFMITPAVYGMDSVRKNILYVKDGIKKQHNIPKVDISKILQPRQATPTSQGQFAVTGKIINPQDLMAYIEFNPRDFEDHFYAEQLSRTLLARELPVTPENVLMQLFLNRAFEQIENGTWMGSQGYTTTDPTDANFQIKYFDGFIRKLLVDGTYVPTGSYAALTGGSSGNIGDKFKEAIGALGTAIISDPYRYEKMKLLVSPVDRLKYEAFLTEASYKNNDTTEKGLNRYRGYDVIDLAGLPENTFLFCHAAPELENNLFFGLNATEDQTLQLQRLQNNSELFFFKLLMKCDTQFAKAAEIFMYTNKTTSTFTA